MFTLLLSKSRKAIVVYDSLFEPKSFDFERDESIVTVVLRMIDRGKADRRFCLFCFVLLLLFFFHFLFFPQCLSHNPSFNRKIPS